MSQLQLVLTLVAVVALVALYAGEKWQEWRRLRRMRDHLRSGVKEDPLLAQAPAGPAPRHPADASGGRSAAKPRIEPVLYTKTGGFRSVDADNDEPTAGSATGSVSGPAEAVATGSGAGISGGRMEYEPGQQAQLVESEELPTPISLLTPAWVEDPVLDCAMEIRCARPTDGVRLIEAGARIQAGGWRTSVNFVVWDAQAQQWILPDRFGFYTDALAAIQIANRAGCLDAAELVRFVSLIQDVAHELNADVDPPDVEAIAKQAMALDELCVRFDVRIGLTLEGVGQAWTPSQLRQAVQNAGLTAVSTQAWVWRQDLAYADAPESSAPVDVFSVKIDDARPDRLLLELDVAAVPESAGAFSNMVAVARRLGERIGARVVDDNRNEIDDRSVQAIQLQLQRVVSEMREAGIVPGGMRARRLFR